MSKNAAMPARNRPECDLASANVVPSCEGT